MKFKEALEIVIEHLDEAMQEAPSREMADACNFLQGLLENLPEEA